MINVGEFGSLRAGRRTPNAFIVALHRMVGVPPGEYFTRDRD
jgi:hypothetical protein